MNQSVVFTPKYDHRPTLMGLLVLAVYFILIFIFRADANFLAIIPIGTGLVILRLLLKEVKRITFSDQVVVEWLLLPTQYFSYSAFRDFEIGKGIALGGVIVDSRKMRNADEFNETILNLLRQREITFAQFDVRMKMIDNDIPYAISIFVAIIVFMLISAFISRINGMLLFLLIIPSYWFLYWLLYHLENIIKWRG